MRALSRSGRGFTLVELIASITIVTILAAVALPRVTAANPFQARGYADTLATNLRKARAVANACAANRLAIAIPCHRAIRGDGALSGYRWGVQRKRWLLAREATP